mgnify:CR=1 FL=1
MLPNLWSLEVCRKIWIRRMRTAGVAKAGGLKRGKSLKSDRKKFFLSFRPNHQERWLG